MTPVVAILVAAGAGSRLGGEVPKALRPLGGRPLVAHAAQALIDGGVDHIVVVVAPGLEAEFSWALHLISEVVLVVPGGDQRQDSVLAGLDAIAADPVLAEGEHVLVHDAARALVPPAVVARVIAALCDGARACIPVVPVIDSIRALTPTGSVVVDRSGLRAVQTPQGFDRELLHSGHRRVQEQQMAVTDDAAVAELMGAEVALVDGDREALKVTEPLDLLLAQAILEAR